MTLAKFAITFLTSQIRNDLRYEFWKLAGELRKFAMRFEFGKSFVKSIVN